MQTKPLLYGLIGFFIGGFLVSVAATTFDKPEPASNNQSPEIAMGKMTTDLKNMTGDNYDKAFIRHMISHHQAAVDMAKLSATNAKHDEIKELSKAIVTAQEKEINDMLQWQHAWGYAPSESNHSTH